jgi:hypothetical protein
MTIEEGFDANEAKYGRGNCIGAAISRDAGGSGTIGAEAIYTIDVTEITFCF